MQAPQPAKLLRQRYRVLRPLRKGGFGQTYIAEDLDLPGAPRCVVKQLKPASHDPIFLDHARRLFHTEAQTLMRLGNYDQIPRLLAYFEEGEEFYLVQELVEGHTITEELLPGKHWTEAAIVEFLEGALTVLHFIHSQGVIHRDVKPDNLLRRRQDHKLVFVDFGTVKEIRVAGLTRRSSSNSVSTIAVGTPGYMPTEQGRGKPRPNSDIYALGVIAIQAATGLNPDQLQEDSETGEIIWQPWSTVSDRLAAILSQMVRYYFRDRYQTTEQVLAELAALLGKAPQPLQKTIPEPIETLVLPLVQVPMPPAIETQVVLPPPSPTAPETPPELETVVSLPLSEVPTEVTISPDESPTVPQIVTTPQVDPEPLNIAPEDHGVKLPTLRTVSPLERSLGSKMIVAGIAAIVTGIAGLLYLSRSKPAEVSPISAPNPLPQKSEAEQNQAILDSAIALAEDGKDSSLEQAIKKTKEIPSNSAIYTKAQEKLYTWQTKRLQTYLQVEVPKKYPKNSDILALVKPEIKKLDANEIVIAFDSSGNPKFSEPELIKRFAAVFTELFRGNQKNISRAYGGFNQLTAYPSGGKQQATLSAKDWDTHIEAKEDEDLILEKIQLRDR